MTPNDRAVPPYYPSWSGLIPNNNLSVLPFYTSLEQQNARKWWAYNKVYPLFVPSGYLLPFQFITSYNTNLSVSNIPTVNLINANTGQVVLDITGVIKNYTTKKSFSSLGYDVWVCVGGSVGGNIPNGRYYLEFTGTNPLYSEIFTIVNDISPYLKIEWWDIADFTTDAGTIVYTNPTFKNTLYLQADIAKPEYPFEEEGEVRGGYFFPVKQISEKRYKFSFLAPEYLLDVMRFIRMADYAKITKNGLVYNVDSFLLTPDWQGNGDIASVEVEFETATVAKKIGLGYIRSE